MRVSRTAVVLAAAGCALALASPAVGGGTNGSSLMGSYHATAGSPFWPDSGRAADADTQLTGVSAVSSTDVWAVGDRLNGTEVDTLTQRWDGSHWTSVASPNPGEVFGSSLAAVEAVAPDDVWAVGSYERPTEGGNFNLIIHWNGSRWVQVPSPQPTSGSSGSVLTSVSAVSSTDVWAVGYYDPLGPDEAATLTEHWDGQRWSIVASPRALGLNRGFFAVSARSSDDVWAVSASGTTQTLNSLVSHWDGHRWLRVASVSPGKQLNVLWSVTTVAPGNAWVVGDYRKGPRSFKLVEHAVHGHVVRKKGPLLHALSSSLFGVSADAPNNVWAVGTEHVGGTSHTLTLHYDGRRWSHVDSPGTGRYSVLNAVTTKRPLATWAAGYESGMFTHAVRERWNGRAWVVK